MYALTFLFLIYPVNAATIYGIVYDLSLKKIDNARVEVNTTPKQFMVAQNGSYSFNVANGIYKIKAQLMQKGAAIASVQENITIERDGSYVLDLILFPDVEEGIEDIGVDLNNELIELEDGKNNFMIGIIFSLIIFIVIVGVYYLRTKKQAKEPEIEEQETGHQDDLGQVINLIKQEGGRTTQKEIRKQIPLSEAKISLMVTELEHKGIIEKIKKGRGNIIILKKK